MRVFFSKLINGFYYVYTTGQGKIGIIIMVCCMSLSITCEKCELLFLCVDIKPKASSLLHGTCTCKKRELLFISVRGRNAKASRLFHGC